MKKISAIILLVVLTLLSTTISSAENFDYYFSARFNKSPRFYTGPGSNYLRAGNGKAQYGGGGQARVYGYEGNWLLLGYETGAGVYRIGYFEYSYINNMTASGSYNLRKMNFEYRNAWINAQCQITDDPVIKYEPFGTLASGQNCKYLANYGSSWAYIEVTVNGKKARGFVPRQYVSFTNHPTVAPFTFAPVITPDPYAGSTGFYTSGVWATASSQLRTYSGPGTRYTSTGTYYLQNQAVYCLAKHYDSSSRAWWVLCRIYDGSGAQYVWANSGSFYNADWLLNRLIQE